MASKIRLALVLVGASLVLSSVVGGIARAIESERVAEAMADEPIAPLRHGDAFVIRRTGGSGTFAEVSLAWEDGSPFLLANGTAVSADRLVIHAPELPHPHREYFVGRATEPIAEDMIGLAYYARDGAPSRDLDPNPKVSSAATRFWSTTYGGWLPFVGQQLCFVKPAWGNLSLDEIEGRELSDLCPGHENGGKLRDGGFEPVNGVPARRFHAGFETVWLAPGYPVPLRIRACQLGLPALCDLFPAAARTWDLEQFQRGLGSEVGRAPPVPQLGPRNVTFTPLAANGPSGTNLTGFSLEDARAVMRAHPKLANLTAWLDAHPEARIYRAYLGLDPTPSPWEGPPTSSWTVAWVLPDGTSWEARAYERELCGPKEGRDPKWDARCYDSRVEDDGTKAIDPPPFPERVMTFESALAVFERERPERVGVVETISFQLSQNGARISVDAREPENWTGISFGQQHPKVVATSSIRFDAATGEVVSRSRTIEKTLSTFAISSNGTWSLVESATTRYHDGLPAPSEGLVLGAAGAGALALLGAGLGARAVTGAVVMYTRLSRSDVTEQPRRRAIVEALRVSPGLSEGEICEAVEARRGPARYHLAVLVRAGALARLESGGFTRYFVAGSDDFAKFAEEAVLLSGGAEARVLEAIRSHPGAHAAEIARNLGVTRVAIHYAVGKLARRGLVREEMDGRRKRLFAREAPPVTS